MLRVHEPECLRSFSFVVCLVCLFVCFCSINTILSSAALVHSPSLHVYSSPPFFTELGNVGNRSIEDLSGGELQRFAIAVVCVQEADV